MHRIMYQPKLTLYPTYLIIYKVANKQEIIRIQNEFYEIYQTDDVARLQRFSRQVDMIAENYKAQSI